MGQRDNFSNSDLAKLNKMYSCRNRPSGNAQQPNRPNRGNRPYQGYRPNANGNNYNNNYYNYNQRPVSPQNFGGGFGFAGPYGGSGTYPSYPTYYPTIGGGSRGPSAPNPIEWGFGVLNSLAQFFG